MRPVVLNIREHPGWESDPSCVYIGRTGHGLDGYFGNECGESLAFRDKAYKRIGSDPEYRARVKGLWGRKLMCFCEGRPGRHCHGHVLAKICEELNMTTNDEHRTPNLRSSAIKMAEKCPRQWRHEYLEGNAQESGPWALIGTAAHSIVDDYLQRRWETPQNHPMLVHVPDTKEKESVVAYCLAREGKRARLIGTEMRFVMDFRGTPLEFTIDAAYWHPGDILEIEDHKTQREYETKDEWAAKIQQRLYPAMARLIWPQARQVRMTVGHIMIGVADAEWVADPDWDEDTWARVAAAQEVMRGPADEERVGEHCRFCPRQSACGTYQHEMNGLASSLIPMLRQEHPAERYTRLVGLEKLVKAEKEAAQKDLVDLVKAEGTVTACGREWTMGKESKRTAPSFAELWEAFMGPDGWDEDAIRVIFQANKDLFTVKLGGLDAVFKDHKGLAARAQSTITQEFKEVLKDAPVDKITKKRPKKTARKE